MINTNKLFFTVLVSAALAACGGGGTSAPITTLTPTSNTLALVTAKTVGAVVNEPFTFADGVPDFGTTVPTTFAFTSTGESPTFSISAGGATATGTTKFGSCTFTVTPSSFPAFPAGSKLAVGQSVSFKTCQLNAATSGGSANGSESGREVKFVLGNLGSPDLNSTGKNLPVVINADGSVIIKGVTIGMVTIAAVTGT